MTARAWGTMQRRKEAEQHAQPHQDPAAAAAVYTQWHRVIGNFIIP